MARKLKPLLCTWDFKDSTNRWLVSMTLVPGGAKGMWKWVPHTWLEPLEGSYELTDKLQKYKPAFPYNGGLFTGKTLTNADLGAIRDFSDLPLALQVHLTKQKLLKGHLQL